MTSFPALRLIAGDALAHGLLSGDPRLDGLVTHDPRSPDSLLSSARAAAARTIDRPALAAALEAGLHELEAPAEALAAAARLRAPGTVVVVTGQQPGLLGGALMVLVKALAAAAVARRLEGEGVPAVPVFWHASEDHDHGEADHVGWSRGGDVARLRLALPEDGRMLSHVPVPAAAGPLVESVLGSLVAGPGRAELERVLRVRHDESFGTWTGRLLARVLGAQGIVVVEPHSLRALAAPVTRHEDEHPGALRAAIARAEAVVAAAEYAAPLDLRRAELTFDVDADGRRRPSRPAGDEPRGPISWNVAARVLAQDVALPVAAQICGPAELGYVALLREAHTMLGVPQPLALARPGVTIVEPAARRACTALDVDPAAVVLEGASAIRTPPHAATDQVADLRRAIAELPPGASPAAERRRRALLREADHYAAALERDAATGDEVRARRVRTVLAGLRPSGRLQERVLSFLPWYAAGGDALVARMLELLGTGDPVHHVLRTEDL